MLWSAQGFFFTKEEEAINNVYARWAGISKHIRHPAFGVEGKLYQNADEVQTQCCRGGTALGYVTRNMIGASGVDNLRPCPDMDTFVLSFALIPNLATLYTHWVEVKDNTTVFYHMNEVASYRLKQNDEKAKLFPDVDNILEWMLLERLALIKRVLHPIPQHPPTHPLAPSSPTENISLEDEIQSEAGGVQLSQSVGSKKRQKIGEGV
ncbi:MAG: hypothetical protein Q9212_001895 [Teloschistes hypoglaucus]